MWKSRAGIRSSSFLALWAVVAGTVAAAGAKVETIAEVAGGTGGVVVDGRGHVYSADFGAVLGDPTTAGTRLFRIAPDGKTSVFAEGFEGASGVAIDSKGTLFQSNIRGSYISRVAADGSITKFAEGVRNPVGIVIDGDDTLWVANCGGGSIQKVTRAGESTTFVTSPLLMCPNGITLDAKGNLYAANFYNGDVVKITPGGDVSVLATLPGGNNGHVVFVDDQLFVVDRGGHQIYRVSLAGEVTLYAGSGQKGGKDGPALQASFCYPNDIAVSPDGKRLYINEVADESSEGRKLAPTRIRVIHR